MITPKPTLLRGTLFLKTGQKIDIVESPDASFNAASFTASTLRIFLGANDKLYFVQGDNVACVELEQSK